MTFSQQLYLLFLLLSTPMSLSAQCSIDNTAIKGDEVITYNMYFNWQFIWVKAGTAAMTTSRTTYQGQEAFRTALTTRGNDRADKLFLLRDTLIGYCTTFMAPLYYRKGAREGKYYTVDEAFYTYKNGRCDVKLHRQKNDGSHSWEEKTLTDCVFDMLNLFQRARSFDLSNKQKGEEIRIDVTDGTKIVPAILRFGGREMVKGDDGRKYSALKWTYIEMVKNKEKTIACFFITDDARHIPIRLDLFLRFGSAKAFLTNIRVKD